MRDERENTAQGNPDQVAFIDVADLVPRPVRSDEIPMLRSIWWRQAAQGNRMPAERSVIVIEGGQR